MEKECRVITAKVCKDFRRESANTYAPKVLQTPRKDFQNVYNKILKTKRCETNKSYINYPHITLKLNLIGRSECRTYQPRVQDSFKRRQANLKLHHPKSLIFMNRDERTEYQLTLCPNLDPIRSLGRSKLINSEFADQIEKNQRSTQRPRTQESGDSDVDES